MSSMKDYLKDNLPMPVVALVKSVLNGYPSLIMASLREARRYNKAYAKDTARGTKQLESRMMYFTHQIEKGLSHKDFRYGFGKRPLLYLARTLSLYQQQVPNYLDSMPYRSALAALGEYLNRHANHEDALVYVKSIFSASTLDAALKMDSNDGGSTHFS